MRVLLVSAIRDGDPNSGDVTYTEQLLSHPPPGVMYTTYADALAQGSIEEIGTRAALRRVISGPFDPRQLTLHLAVAIWRKAEYGVRRSGFAFRETVRHFRVATGEFDVIHVHVFNTRFFGDHPPIVMSAAGPLEWVYRDAWGWPEHRLRTARIVDRCVGALWDATMCATRGGRSRRFIAFTQYLKDWMVAHGTPTDQICVVPNYMVAREPSQRDPERVPTRLGFVAKDFDAKGGQVVLDAFELLRGRRDDISLVIVGSPPRLEQGALKKRRIQWEPFVDRDILLGEILPEVDIFVYPSTFDGLPYGPMEALSMAIPLVVSDYRALPEMASRGAGRVVSGGDAASVAAAVEELLEPGPWRAASSSARALFESHYDARSQAARLGSIYAEVCEDWPADR